MRFGGHESFAVREGWLSRGLELLANQPELLVDQHAEDHLGVGRNMAKAIRHWLVAAGLASASTATVDHLAFTPFGKQIFKSDPHLLDLGTWWMLHVNLVCNKESAFAWNWFFNQWAIVRFERSPCIEGLKRFCASSLQRAPKAATLEREIATLLQSYARPIPAKMDDPEDSADSPFQDLNLVYHHGASGYYQLNFDPKNISRWVLGYALAKFNGENTRTEFSISELERAGQSPGRCFLLRGDDLYDLVLRCEDEDPKLFSLRSQAGERGVRLGRKLSDVEWAKGHYENLEVAING